MQSLIKFFSYCIYRSAGLITLLIYQIIITRDMTYFIILSFFLVHTYRIYRLEDGGTNHIKLMTRLDILEAKAKDNNNEIIKSIQDLKLVLKKN